MIEVGVVIRTLNEGIHIGPLLCSLQEQALKPTQVVVVDSGSTDGTPEIAEANGADVVRIRKEEFTFGRSLNIGISHLSTPIVVAASAHVLPENQDWLKLLVGPLVRDDRCVLSYGKQRAPSGAPFSEQQIMRRWFPENSDLEQRHGFCNNANSAFRKSDWSSHPFDEDLPGLEDLEFARHFLSESDRYISYVADAGILHIHDEDTAGTRRRYSREAFALARLTGEHLTPAHALALAIANIGRDWLAAIKRRELRSVAAEVVLFRRAQFAGALEGGRLARGEVAPEDLKRRYYYPIGIQSMPTNRRRKRPQG